MKLEELIPQEGKIKLVDPEKEYILRPFTLQDEVWVRKTFGDEIDKIFQPDCVDLEGLSRIAYHQLADKSDFVVREVTTVNEEGEEVTERIGGYKLFMSRVKGINHKMELLFAVNETLGASRPDMEEGEVVKKKGKAKK